VRRSFPQTTGELSLPGPTAPVDVVRDDRGIPQIGADGPEDLFFARGYVHARDRFFEADFRRRSTSGRLSDRFATSQGCQGRSCGRDVRRAPARVRRGRTSARVPSTGRTA